LTADHDPHTVAQTLASAWQRLRVQDIEPAAVLQLGAGIHITGGNGLEGRGGTLMNSSAALECADTRNRGSTIRTGKLAVNFEKRLVTVDGDPVHLTPKEYEILELLSMHKGTTLTKEMILNHLYGGVDEPKLKIIDVFVCKLRKKLAHAIGGHHYIETVWGRGYILQDPAIRSARTAAGIDWEGAVGPAVIG
jgi:DNA-binding winged helix-turn-helix (wHTH) protein